MNAKRKTPPTKCMRCGSDNLTASEVFREPYASEEEVTCDDCGHTWIERYKLTLLEVEEIDDDTSTTTGKEQYDSR